MLLFVRAGHLAVGQGNRFLGKEFTAKNNCLKRFPKIIF